MAEAGRLHHESAGAIKSKPEAERAEAQEQLPRSCTCGWRSCAVWQRRGGLAPEHVVVLGEQHDRAKPCKKIEGKEGWTRIEFCLDPVTLPLEGALEAALQLQKGVRKHGPDPRGSHPSEKRRGS